MRKKCLLIGGCGFLLSNFVRKCLYAKDETLEFVTLDKLLYKHSIQNYYANKHHKFHIGDVCDFHQLKSIVNFEKPDVVIFGAGDKTINSIQTKLVGLENLSKLSSQFERLIYLSNTDISEPAILPKTLQVSFENSSELFIKQDVKFKYNILRLPSVFGPRQNLEEDVAMSINCALNNLKFLPKTYSNTNRLYIDDFCSALMSVIEKGLCNKIYSTDIMVDYVYSVEINQMIEKIHQSNLSDIIYEEYLKEDPDDYTKALINLGWTKQTSLNDGLQETYNWYKNNSWFGRSNETL